MNQGIESLQGSWKYFPLACLGKVTDYCFDRLFGILGEGKIVEIIFSQVRFHG
jgi:hypothetical protein